MRKFYTGVIALAMASGAALEAQAPPSSMLSNPNALQLCRGLTQAMDAATQAVPGLATSAAPILAEAKQTLGAIQALPNQGGSMYAFLNQARSFLALADATPKPSPMPAAGQQAFADLRDGVDRLEAHFRALLDFKERQLRSPDRDNLRRYSEADERLGPPSPDKPRVVFLGDSITDGWRLNEYFTGRDFVNRGIGGQITGEMLGRMKADVIDLKPQAMIVLAGTNDIARGVTLKTIENNLTMMADLADFHKIKVMMSSVLPISDYHKDTNPQNERSKQRPPATILELNRWIQDLCARRHYVYVDYFPALVDQAGYIKAELADDGLHPNAGGYRVMAPIALEAIGRVVGAQAEPGQTRKRR